MAIGVFIDLNCYRFTGDVFSIFLQDIAAKNIIDLLAIYNYSPILHKSYDFPKEAKLYLSLSGRRKVMIDIRQACDMVNYASCMENCSIFTLAAMVDSSPLFNKLQELNAHVTLASPTPIKANVNNYHYLSRSAALKEGHFQTKNFSSKLLESISDNNSIVDNSKYLSPKDDTPIGVPITTNNNSQKNTYNSSMEHNTFNADIPSDAPVLIANKPSKNLTNLSIDKKATDDSLPCITEYDLKLDELEKLITNLYR